MYYTVRSVDASDIESRNSLAIEMSEDENLIALSSDNTVAIVIPKSEGSVFYKDTSPYGDNMKIDISRDSSDEGGMAGRIFRSFDMNLVDSDETSVSGFEFNGPVDISFDYEAAVQGAPGISTLADALYGIGLLWHNGVEYVKVGGSVNTENNTISIRTKQLGKYRIVNVLRATAFEFVQLWPRRIFTPNGDGINDTVNFIFENPKLSVVSGKIYDIHGAYVADIAPGDDITSLVWDGKDKSGSYSRKGIYIYQIKCEGKVYNGTVVVAR